MTRPSRTGTPAEDASRSVHFVSLGCPKNRVDTEVMLGVSDGCDFEVVPDAEGAEVIVVNTCGFIEAAKQESIDTILEMARHKERGSCRKLVVTGCLSQRYPEELAEAMPEVDHFLGSSDMLKLQRVLQQDDAERMLVGHPADYLFRADHPRRLADAPHSAYLKIAEGCSRKCSFCSIPSFRGTQRSRPIEDIVEEAQRLVDGGTVELNLISQDTISYGRDLRPHESLERLVKALADIRGLRWIRLFYLYPERLSEELLDLLAHEPKLLPYVDMPLQHASDAMLRRMKRGHGGERLRRVVDRLRERIPELTLRSAFIVGHPGETAADFEALYDFVRWARFDRMGVFLYSHEEGTASHAMKGRVPERTMEARRRRLMTLQRRISRERLRAMVGKTLEVLVEGPSTESDLLLEGRHMGQAPEIDGKVILANGEACAGELRHAVVTESADYDLVATLLDADGRMPELPPGAETGALHLPVVG